jgi:2-polyprenyl-3-methyl-5-hydroxy-6-metoxy-1,4-benzoquinol methylase
MRDPWTINSIREKYRFSHTNDVIIKEFGWPESILEIGCGEGFQSIELAKICDHLHGLDISERAVKRAKRRYTKGQFNVGDIFTIPLGHRFDLVTAFEVIYYPKDTAAFLSLMSALGRSCMVSYYGNPVVETRVANHIKTIPGSQFKIVDWADMHWTLAWWRT